MTVEAAVALSAELRQLALLVRRLSPDRRDPEKFHVEKSEAAARLAMLARRVELMRSASSMAPIRWRLS